MRSHYLVLAFALFAIGLFSCTKDDTNLQVQKEQSPLLNENGGCDYTVTKFTDGPGGNAPSCEGYYDYSTGVINVPDGDETADFFAGTYTTDDGLITYWFSADGKYMYWSSTDGVCGMQINVKGGPATNIYIFSEDECNGGTVHAPEMTVGRGRTNIPAVSNFEFCYNECQGENPDPCKGETAWGGNSAGAGPAWWYYFNTSGPACQNLYAGQNLVAGASVCYDGQSITIDLGPGNSLQAGNETVKIQGYNGSVPTFRPSAGQFTTYKGTSLSVPVPAFDYYAIHLDMIVCTN